MNKPLEKPDTTKWMSFREVADSLGIDLENFRCHRNSRYAWLGSPRQAYPQTPERYYLRAPTEKLLQAGQPQRTRKGWNLIPGLEPWGFRAYCARDGGAPKQLEWATMPTQLECPDVLDIVELWVLAESGYLVFCDTSDPLQYYAGKCPIIRDPGH